VQTAAGENEKVHTVVGEFRLAAEEDTPAV